MEMNVRFILRPDTLIRFFGHYQLIQMFRFVEMRKAFDCLNNMKAKIRVSTHLTWDFLSIIHWLGSGTSSPFHKQMPFPNRRILVVVISVSLLVDSVGIFNMGRATLTI